VELWTLLELLYFDALVTTAEDPVIAQVPADVTDITATYTNFGALTGQMVVTAGLQAVQVTPTVTITPEAGQQLVIIEFPNVEGLIPGPDEDEETFTVTINATVDPPRDIEVKAITSAKVTQDGTDYYLPLFPGVTDFSLVPSFTIPLAGDYQHLELPTAADLPDTPERLVYDMSPADDDGDDGDDDGDDGDDGDNGGDDGGDDGDGGDDSGDDDTKTGGGGGGGGSCFIHCLAS